MFTVKFRDITVSGDSLAEVMRAAMKISVEKRMVLAIYRNGVLFCEVTRARR